MGSLEVTVFAGTGFTDMGVQNNGTRVQLDSFTYNTPVEASSRAVPDQGSSLALLAMGAGGILGFRRLRGAQEHSLNRHNPMKTQKKNRQSRHLQTRKNRWKWMAGATAAAAAGVSASQASTITITLNNNYISAAGGNHLNADLTGNGDSGAWRWQKCL